MSAEKSIFKDLSTILPEIKNGKANYIVGEAMLYEQALHEAEQRGVSIEQFVQSSLNLIIVERNFPDGFSLSLRDRMGFEESLDLMREEFKPTPFDEKTGDVMEMDVDGEQAVDYITTGWRHHIPTHEVIGRGIVRGLKISEGEREGKMLMLCVPDDSFNIPLLEFTS